MSTMNPVVHFEMPAEDRKRMAKFYEQAFGWKPVVLGEGKDGYTIVQTDETDENGMLLKTGRINGGFYDKSDEKPAQYPSVVIAVENIKEAMKNVNGSGGKVIGEPVEIPGFGMYVSFYDTEGNRTSIMEPTKEWKEKTT